MQNWKRKLKCKFVFWHIMLMRFGHWTGCHQLSERSFYIKGFQFPLCARCTGIVAGYLFGTAMFLCKVYIPLEICVAGAVVMFFDWYIQYIGLLPSTNIRRFVTGLLCGACYLHFLVKILYRLWNYLIMWGIID